MPARCRRYEFRRTKMVQPIQKMLTVSFVILMMLTLSPAFAAEKNDLAILDRIQPVAKIRGCTSRAISSGAAR